MNPTGHSGITPLPTILAKQDPGVHVRTSYGSDMVSYIEASVNKHFRILTALNVPDVDPH